MTVLPDADVLETALGEAERREEAAQRRRGLILAVPSFAYMILFFAVPLVIVLVYSFATRTSTGSTSLSDWNLDAYRKLGEPIVRNVVIRSIVLALITTVLCLVIAYPFAYFCATRSVTVRNLLLVAVMIPFWTNFLVRNYAWRLLLSSGGPISSFTESIGLGPTEILFTKTAVVIGLVYAYLPFMVLPLYSALEKMDQTLLEAAADLGCPWWKAFWLITLPLSLPGILAGVLLCFIPIAGEFVIPDLLGGSENVDRKSTRLNSSHVRTSRMPSSA